MARRMGYALAIAGVAGIVAIISVKAASLKVSDAPAPKPQVQKTDNPLQNQKTRAAKLKKQKKKHKKKATRAHKSKRQATKLNAEPTTPTTSSPQPSAAGTGAPATLDPFNPVLVATPISTTTITSNLPVATVRPPVRDPLRPPVRSPFIP